MKNFAVSLLLCSLINFEQYNTMAMRVGSKNRFIADTDGEDWMAQQQIPQSLAAVRATSGDEKKEEKKAEGKDGEAKEGEEEAPPEPSPEVLKARADQAARDATDASAAEKMRILKEIGVHDIDPKHEVYGSPIFKEMMVKYLPHQIEQKEMGKHWENNWHLVEDVRKNDWDVNEDGSSDKSQEGYMPIKEDYDEIAYAKSIGRGPGWEIAKKHRNALSKQFKEEEAKREAEAAAAAAAAAEGGEEGKEGGAEGKEEKKEEKKEAKALTQSGGAHGDAEPSQFVVEPIADVKNYGATQDFAGELGYVMAQTEPTKVEVAPGQFIIRNQQPINV